MVSGINTPESYIIENIVNAKNAYRGKGNRVILSSEQVYAVDPDTVRLIMLLLFYHQHYILFCKTLMQTDEFLYP